MARTRKTRSIPSAAGGAPFGTGREEKKKGRRWSSIRRQYETYKSKLMGMGEEGRDEIASALDDVDISAAAVTKILDKKESELKSAEKRKIEELADNLRDRHVDIGQAFSHTRVMSARAKARRLPKPSKPGKPTGGKKAKAKRDPAAPKHHPGRRVVAEGIIYFDDSDDPDEKKKKKKKKKEGGVKWWINRVPTKWDKNGQVTEYSLEPKLGKKKKPAGVSDIEHLQRGANVIVPPANLKEGDEVCLEWGDPKKGQDPDKCIKFGAVPKLYTDPLFFRSRKRASSVDRVDDRQRLYPIGRTEYEIDPETGGKIKRIGQHYMPKGAKPDDFIPARYASIAKDGRRPSFLEQDSFTDYRRRNRLSGITWEEQHAQDLAIKMRRVITNARLWYEEHGLKPGRRLSMTAARKKRAEEHKKGLRKVGARAVLPSGTKRVSGRTPRELRVLRERRRQAEVKERKARKKMGIRGPSAAERISEETARERKRRDFINEVRASRGLPPLPNPRLRMTKAAKSKMLARDFALSKKRMYPVHTIKWSRQSMEDAIQDFDKGKITKSECRKVVNKGNAQIEKLIDDAMGRYVNPGGPKENPTPAFLKRVKKDPTDAPRAQAQQSVRNYMKMRKMYETSARQGRPRWDYLMEAYDSIENARANFEVAGMARDAREAQAQKKAVHGMLLAFLEQGETGEVTVRGPTTVHTGWWYDLGLKKKPKSTTEVKRAYRRMASEVHPDAPGGSAKKFRRLKAAMTCAGAYMDFDPDIEENPSKSEHQKRGLQFLKKSQAHWTKYYKGHADADLMAAYKWLVLAEEELKVAGDKANLKEARAGLRAATAEMKDRLD